MMSDNCFLFLVLLSLYATTVVFSTKRTSFTKNAYSFGQKNLPQLASYNSVDISKMSKVLCCSIGSFFITAGIGFSPEIPNINTLTVNAAELTATDLIRTDVSPRLDLLKDVLFVFKLYPTYAEKGDYISIR